MPKCLSARIIVDLYPHTSYGLTSLLETKCNIAKWTPTPRIEEVGFGRFKRITSDCHGLLFQQLPVDICRSQRIVAAMVMIAR